MLPGKFQMEGANLVWRLPKVSRGGYSQEVTSLIEVSGGVPTSQDAF